MSQETGAGYSGRSGLMTDWQPMNDGVLVQRIEKPVPQGRLALTDDSPTNGPVLREGIVLAVGPGKWVPGEWWKVRKQETYTGLDKTTHGKWYQWEWFDGYHQEPIVKPGMKVLFNARWNDLRHGELKGTGADGSGPLERPLSYKFDPAIHLIQEADIAGIIG